MSVRTTSWEYRLTRLAYEALDSNVSAEHDAPAATDTTELQRAYAYCADLTKVHSKTFYMASSLLPAEKRRAMRALYAFCRVSDDLVDRHAGDREAALTAWQRRALSDTPSCDDVVAVAWADTRARYNIPRQYAEQLIAGVARDLNQTRYETFEDLSVYCYGVASTVGLMAMHIIGFDGPNAIPYAVKLGVALQLTNILRDIGEDWRAGRVYLPQDELYDFGLTDDDIGAGVVDDRWRRFMEFQIERNRRLYREALPGVRMLNRDGRFAVAAAAELYRAILHDIEKNDADVFSRRAFISKWGKLRRLPGIWWRSVGALRVA